MQSLPSNAQIPSSTAFAQNGDRADIAASSDRQMNWSSGFPEIFSRLLSDGGKYVKREDMNAILYALSNEALYRQWGGLVSYNATVSNTIFGYPVGATLIYKDPQTGALSFVESQVANNQIPPSSATIDTKTDINGQYADNGVVRWKTVLSNEGQSVPYINVPILTPMWFDHKVTNPEWIESEMEYTINNNYGWLNQGSAPKIYEHLRGDVSTATSKTETVAGVTITYYESEDKHKIVVANGEAWDGTSYQKYANAVDSIFEKTGIAWYYILDETNGCFRLPRTKFQSFALGNSVTVPVVGNGNTLGFTEGSGRTFGIFNYGGAYGFNPTSNLGPVGTSATHYSEYYSGLMGVSTDPSKSGLIASGTLKSETDANFYLYFCAAEYVSSSGGGGSGGVIDGTLLCDATIKEVTITPTVQKVYTVQNDCALFILDGIVDGHDNQAYTTCYYLDEECTLPVFSHSESYTTYAEDYGSLVPLKKGCDIYVKQVHGGGVTYQTQIAFYEYALTSIAPQIAMPDYSAEPETITDSNFEAPSNGWVFCAPNPTMWSECVIYDNHSHPLLQVRYTAGYGADICGGILPVSKGDILVFSFARGDMSTLKPLFYPCKTVQQSTPPAYITRYGRDASTGYWYRIYSDGFCEQGGTATSFPGGGAGTVELPVSYADTNYQAFTDSGNAISEKYKGSIYMAAPGDWHTMGYVF